MATLPVLGQASVCQRCAGRGPTCCEPEDGIHLAPLTLGDVSRIAAGTGLLTAQFVAERVIDADEVAAIEEQDPVLRGLVGADGVVRSLAKRGRACVFLTRETGCSLPYEIRPLLCRRFPIVKHRTRMWVSPGGDCLAVEESNDIFELMAMLGLNKTELSRIERAIRNDLTRTA